MARPKDADPENTKSAIVAAAVTLLEEAETPGSLSLRAVAARVECSLGTIQHYFPTKRALLDCCLEGYRQRRGAMAAQLTEAIARGDHTGGALIEHSARVIYRFAQRERVSLLLLLATEHGTLSEDALGTRGLVAATAELIAPHCEVPSSDVALALKSLGAIIVRLASLTDSERAHLSALEPSEGREATEAYVARAARRLLRPLDG